MPSIDQQIDAVWSALNEVADPCMAAGGHRVSIVDLGLITGVESTGRHLDIGITFTEVGCPFTHRVIDEIETRVNKLMMFESVKVTPGWLPGWTPGRMNDVARTALKSSQLQLRDLLAQPAHTNTSI